MSEQVADRSALQGMAVGDWRVAYTPGDWLVLSGPTSVVVLQPASGQWSALINSIWDAVVAASSVHDLAAKLSTFGLDDMPSFATFFWASDGMHSLIRGDIRAIDPETGKVVAEGAGVLTWNEIGLGAIERVRIEMQPVPGGEAALELPLVVGAVSASTILVDGSQSARVFSPQLLPEEQREETAVVPEPTASLPEPVEGPEPEPVVSAPVVPVPEPLPIDPYAGFGGDEPTEGLDTEVYLPEDAPPAPAPVAEPDRGPLVYATWCPNGHTNAPEAGICRLCRVPIAMQSPQQIPRPVLAVLMPSTSGPVDLDRPVLVGRSPSTSRADGDQLPWLLTVPSPSHDISRTHLQVAPDGWKLIATDLQSTNGTVLIRPNEAPVRMPSGQPVEVTPGCVLDLGDGVTIAIDNPQA